jgi:hypothetical protein
MFTNGTMLNGKSEQRSLYRLVTVWTAEESTYPLHVVQTGYEIHEDFYPMSSGVGALSPGVKRPGRETYSSLSAEVKKT